MSAPETVPAWRRGLVMAVDAGKCKVRVKFPDEDGIVSDWLPVCVPFALGAKAYWMPRVNSQVVALVDEHGEDGIVMGAIYSNVDTPPVSSARVLHIVTEDGTKIQVDPDASTVTVDTPGDIVAKAGKTINGTAGVSATLKAPLVTLDAPLTVCTGIVRVAGLLEVDGGIGTTAGGQGGAIPGNLRTTGTITGETDLVSGSLSFNAHVHTEQGDGNDTSTPH